MRILKMVQEGKLTPEEAAKLLEALESTTPAAPAAVEKAGKLRFIRVRVQEGNGRKNVNITLPIALANLAMKFVPEVGGDWEEVLQAIKAGNSGKLVDVVDEEKNAKVEIYVE